MQNTAAQLLSFRLRIARTREDVLAACRVRAQAYGHHMPHLRDALLSPDAVDEQPGVVILLCVDKRSREPVGTLRLQTSFWGPLLIEASVPLPDEVCQASRMELTRLAIVPGADPTIKRSLMKASFLYGRAMLVRRAVVGVRDSSRALFNQYQRLLFSDVFPEGVTFPLKHAANMAHRILANDLSTVEQRWRDSGHEWLEFMVATWHPDIDLFAGSPALSPAETQERLEALPLAA